MREIFYIVSRWFLFLIILMLACYLFYARIYQVYGPKVADIDTRLPNLLHSSPMVFWFWMLGSAVVAGSVGYWSLRAYRRLDSPPNLETIESAQDDPTLNLARDAIVNLRRGHEREPAYLIIAEGEGPIALLAAADLGPTATAPDEPAPIRGFQTAEGLFLQCAGPDPKGARAACQLLVSTPETPPLRGIVVQVSAAMLLGPKPQTIGHATRVVLREAAEATTTRCPVYVVVSGMEDVPGFVEFAHRSPAEYRVAARFGFSLPRGEDSSLDSVAREYDRLGAWYNLAILDFFETEPLQQEGNEALFSLSRWLLQVREPLLHFLEAVKPGGDDPLELVNCYFAATGNSPGDRAFVEGLVQVKVVGDARSTRWSNRTLMADQRLRRMGIRLGFVGGIFAVAVWALIFVVLRPTGWLVILMATAIVAGWGAAWYEMLRGFRSTMKSSSSKP